MDSEREASEVEGRNSPVEVKKEPTESEDIKDYAANTMNELLAIYGYDEKVDKSVTEDLQLHNFSGDKGKKSKREGKRKSSRLSQREQQPGDCTEEAASASGSTSGSTSGGSDLEVARTQLYTAIRSAAELESRASFEQQIICAWCQHAGVKRYTLNTATESKAFCSEKCFAACRRAYFKRNKVCDWCRHIRHTKEYVEFQSRDAKLQFCSVKCLNQYKMDVFCKETQSLGTTREYQMEVLCNDLPSQATTGGAAAPSVAAPSAAAAAAVAAVASPAASPAAAPAAAGDSRSVTVVSPVTTSKKGKKPVGLKNSSEARSKVAAESSSGASSPLALTTGASNGTVRQIQTMLQNRGTSRVQAQADSTVPSSSGLSIQTVAPVISGAPPQAAINAAASVQAAAALQQSTFLGVPAVFQAPVANPSHGQVLGQTPLVVSGNQIPIIQQQGSNVILQSQQIGAPPQIVNPSMSTSPSSLQGIGTPPPNPTKTTSQQKQSPSATPSSVLPPLTIIVPHPIFVPIPIPVPVPIPIRAEAYDAAKKKADTSKHEEFPKQMSDSSGTEAHGLSTFSESDEGRSQSLVNLTITDNMHEDSHTHSILHDRVRILKGLQKPSSSMKSTSNLLLSSFPASNGLHRSASLDLSLASRQNNAKSSLNSVTHHGDDRKVKTQLVLVGEETGAMHEGRESSRKVREALRCHLNKRLSQSALNLAELGLVSSDSAMLRRSCSLSRLRESTVGEVNSLGQGADHQKSSPVPSPDNKSPTKKPRRVLDSCNMIEEDIEMEKELMIHEADPSELGPEDEQDEPSCKRKKWTNNSENT